MVEPKIYKIYSSSGKENVQEQRRKRLSLFLSLLFHSLVLLLSVKFFQPMGELFKEEDVRAVFLAEREDLFFPDSLLRPDRLRSSAEIPPSKGSAQEETTGVESQDVPSVTRGEVEEYLGSLYSRAVASEPEKFQIDPELLERFQLAPPNENKFQLSIDPELQSEAETKLNAPREAKSRNDLLIALAAGSNARLKKLLASSDKTGRNSTSFDQASGQRARFDIQSWAVKALARIEMNWTLDPLLAHSLNGTVGISITIARSGEIRSIEIVKSSGYASLDRIAQNALEASDPLPGISEDFPDQILTLYFEFEYGK
jgi:TonB family protein